MGQAACCQKPDEYHSSSVLAKNKIAPVIQNGHVNTAYEPTEIYDLHRDESSDYLITPKKKHVSPKLHNHITGKVVLDALHVKSVEETECRKNICHGSVVNRPSAKKPRAVKRDKQEILEQAKDFMEQYYTSLKQCGSKEHMTRLTQITDQINKTGIYEQTYDEIVFGAKTAWRNAPRCIGRIQWNNLKVFDCRNIRTAREMFEALVEHLDYATNKGNIRSVLTIFPPRHELNKDFKVWNKLLIHFAGYRQPDGSVIGDPANVAFTELCMAMGWPPKYGRFDVLPLVLQANGEDPQWFDIPKHVALTVSIKHPKHDWLNNLDLQWYAVPCVSSMMFDCGGIEYTGAPFNGWYMGTEVGSRDFCDESRYNILQEVAENIGLDTDSNLSLWKDEAAVEINKAVLYSYQKAGVTMVDHHTASNSFIKHMQNETKLRGGCPADWVWIVPPLSSSSTEVYHQEMLRYHLKPSYEYQEEAWIRHAWQNPKMTRLGWGPKEHVSFKLLAKVISAVTSMANRQMNKRKKCLILYATETGRSETFAHRLHEVKSSCFRSTVMCMDEYNVKDLASEDCVYFVASTFGNGDAPRNGEKFFEDLNKWLESYKSRRSSGDLMPLKNVNFSVFALGSTGYPKFCAFGKKLDELMTNLGAKQMFPVGTGDELTGQEQSFISWIQGAFKASLKTFRISEADMSETIEKLSRDSDDWVSGKFRLVKKNVHDTDLHASLEKIHKKNIMRTKMIEQKNLQAENSGRQTLMIKLQMDKFSEIQEYEPGDHVGVYPQNQSRLVNGIIKYLKDTESAEVTYQVERTTKDTSTGWRKWRTLPATSIRTALANYLDITTTPNQKTLENLVPFAADPADRQNLQRLVENVGLYEEWKTVNSPTVLEVFEEFPSLCVPFEFLLTQLPILQPRFYSISSSHKVNPEEIHLTVAVVKYRTRNGTGPEHFGVASNWMNCLEIGDTVHAFIRPSTFRLPEDPSKPVIMVGPGTGIAPYRSFWQEREFLKAQNPNAQFGDLDLYYGCRNRNQDYLYKEELFCLEQSLPFHVYLAISREPSIKKTYVQHIIKEQASRVFDQIYREEGYFYICGDIEMAEEVQEALESILKEKAKMDNKIVKNYIDAMKNENRLQKDLFGARSSRS